MKKYTILLLLLAATIIQLKAQLIVNAGPDTVVCWGSGIYVGGTPTATGGTPPYSYQWSPSLTVSGQFSANPFVSPVDTTTYTVVVTDANGGTASDDVTVNVRPNTLTAHLANVNGICTEVGDILVFELTANIPWLNAFADFGDGQAAGPDAINNVYNQYWNSGHYVIQYYVSDSNECYFYDTLPIDITDHINPHMQNTSDGIMPDTIYTAPTGGSGNYNYTWSSGETTQNIIVTSAGQYCVTVADVNGCNGSACVNAGPCSGCVWPGDANYDGIVDNNDLLAIGLGYGTAGTARANASIVFTAQPATDWADTLADGTNYKHIDCNGNGAINGDDTTAILQNYNLSHPRSGGEDEWRGGVPALIPVFDIDTAFDGSSITVSFLLGDASNPATDVYGLAFNLNYDAIAVDTTLTSVSFGNSWLGTVSEKISLGVDQPAQGQINLAVTRIDQANRSGNGSIGTALFVITTDNINGKDYYNFRATISDVVMIDNNGQLLGVNAGADSALIEYEPSAIGNISYAQVSVMPNPTNNFIKVNGVKAEAGEMNIYNIAGALVKQVPYVSANTVDVSGLQNGMYFIEIKTSTTTYKGKFNKIGR